MEPLGLGEPFDSTPRGRDFLTATPTEKSADCSRDVRASSTRGILRLSRSLAHLSRLEAEDVLRNSAPTRSGRSCVRRPRDPEGVRLVRRLWTEGNGRLLRVAGVPRRGADGGRGWSVGGGRRDV